MNQKVSLLEVPMFKEHLREKIMLSETSVYVYGHCVKKFLINDPDLLELDSYNQFLIAHSIKKRNSHYYSILRAFIEYKISDNNLKAKLLDGLIKPPIRKDIVVERKYLNEDKILDIINSLQKEKHRIIAIIQNLTGVRAGDILRLRQGRIVPEEYKNRPVLRLNIIGKRKKRNVVFLHDEIAQKLVWNYILTHEGVNEYYFLELGKLKHRPGTYHDEHKMVKMNYHWYWQDLKQALQINGVNKEDFATHDFRRCFARRAWEKYKDVHILKGLLNHSQAETTLRYLEHSGLKNIDYLREMQTE